MTRDLANVLSVFEGSDASATIALYEDLLALGASGAVAIELFRAQKASSRAKVYRGGGFKGKAYDKKQWALNNLAKALAEHGGIVSGWKQDPRQEFHNWVFYVDLPNGQVSFHSALRGEGQIYAGDWDGVKNMSPSRICRFIADLFKNADSAGQTPAARSEHEGRSDDLMLQGVAVLPLSGGEA